MDNMKGNEISLDEFPRLKYTLHYTLFSKVFPDHKGIKLELN